MIRTHGPVASCDLDLVHTSQNRDVGAFEQRYNDMLASFPKSSTESGNTGDPKGALGGSRTAEQMFQRLRR
jgi:hypothetical protein